MTDEQLRARMMVIGRNGPIKIHVAKRPKCVLCAMSSKVLCKGCEFKREVARAAGRFGDFLKDREELQWYFWHATPEVFQQTTFGQPGPTLFVFRTFRAACDKVREIFKEHGQ